MRQQIPGFRTEHLLLKLMKDGDKIYYDVYSVVKELPNGKKEPIFIDKISREEIAKSKLEKIGHVIIYNNFFLSKISTFENEIIEILEDEIKETFEEWTQLKSLRVVEGKNNNVLGKLAFC